jgi:hypothetical protein
MHEMHALLGLRSLQMLLRVVGALLAPVPRA